MYRLRLLQFLPVALVLSVGAGASYAQQPAPSPPRSISIVTDGSAYLGVYAENITTANESRYGLQSPKGVGISKVAPQSPAERAGLKQGDVIVRFDGEEVGSVRKLNRLIGETAPDHTVRLGILRQGNEQEVSAVLSKRVPLTAIEMPEIRAQIPEIRTKVPDINVYGKMPQIMIYGGASQRMGASTSQLTPQLAGYFHVASGRGLLVTSVKENSAAARAGLKAGDVIYEADGQSIGSSSELGTVLQRATGEVSLKIMRDKHEHTIKITPEKAPSSFAPGDEALAPEFDFEIPKFDFQMPQQGFDVPLQKSLEQLERLDFSWNTEGVLM